MSVTGDAERSVPDVRGHLSRSAEGKKRLEARRYSAEAVARRRSIAELIRAARSSGPFYRKVRRGDATAYKTISATMVATATVNMAMWT